MPVYGARMDVPYGVADDYFGGVETGLHTGFPLGILEELCGQAHRSLLQGMLHVVPHHLPHQAVALGIGCHIHRHRLALHHALCAQACLHVAVGAFQSQTAVEQLLVAEVQDGNLPVQLHQAHSAVDVAIDDSLLGQAEGGACESGHYCCVAHTHIEFDIHILGMGAVAGCCYQAGQMAVGQQQHGRRDGLPSEHARSLQCGHFALQAHALEP